MELPHRPDHGAERALLTRARRGDTEALRGMLHRYASLIWSVCALASPDEEAASGRFVEAWDGILRSLAASHRRPDLPGLLLARCADRLSEAVPEETVRTAVASAAQMAADEKPLDVPAAALRAVEDSLPDYGRRLSEETAERRLQRRRHRLLPGAIGVAVALGLLIGYWTTSRPSPRDIVARSLRSEVVRGDLVSRFRECASPPFSVAERDLSEARDYEQISLVLEELSNMPAKLTARRLAELGGRVSALGLDEFAAQQAERAHGDTRQDLHQVATILEEIANL